MKKIKISNILKTISLFLFKSTGIIVSLVTMIPFLIVFILYLVDNIYENGRYLETILSYLLNIGFLKQIFSSMSVANVAILLGLCLFLLILKTKLRKFLKQIDKETNLLKAVLSILGNVVVNLSLMVGVLILWVSSIVFGYINTVFDSYVDSTKTVSYIDKFNYIESYFEDSKTSASMVLHKLMLDIQTNPEYVTNLSNEDYKTLCYEINDLMEQKGGPETMEEHYFRNYFERAPETLDEMLDTIQGNNGDFGWQLMPISDSLFHMSGEDGEYNLKFVSGDGFFEAVYNKKGELLTAKNDPANMGTYNYADPVSDSAKHSLYNVFPFLQWGNTLFTGEVFIDTDQYENNPDAQQRYLEISELLSGNRLS